MRLEILPVTGIGEVAAEADLAALTVTAAPWLRDGDVLVVTSKIVSKAEGRLIEIPRDGPDRAAARDAALRAESARVVARRGHTTIAQTRHGFVMASAGIDSSNVDRAHLVLLPEDPDASARALRTRLRQRHDRRVAVVVSDTTGRPWRTGLTDVALGAAGIPALRDHRGETDPYGNELHLTQLAVVDELAGAAELVKGKCDKVPIAVVRGYPGLTGAEPDGPGVAALIRDPAQDLFRLGSAEAHHGGLLAAATLTDPDPTQAEPPAAPARPAAFPPDLAAAHRAVLAVAGVVAPGTVFTPHAPAGVRPATVAARLAEPVGPTALIRFGADLHRLRVALAAEGVLTTLRLTPDDPTTHATLELIP